MWIIKTNIREAYNNGFRVTPSRGVPSRALFLMLCKLNVYYLYYPSRYYLLELKFEAHIKWNFYVDIKNLLEALSMPHLHLLYGTFKRPQWIFKTHLRCTHTHTWLGALLPKRPSTYGQKADSETWSNWFFFLFYASELCFIHSLSLPLVLFLSLSLFEGQNLLKWIIRA